MKKILTLFLSMTTYTVFAQDVHYVTGIVTIQFESGVNHKSGINNFNQIIDEYDIYSIERSYPFLDLIKATSETEENLFALRRSYTVKYHANVIPENVANHLSMTDGIRYAEPVALLKTEIAISSFIPNDPGYHFFQDYLKKLQFPEAWEIVKGDDISNRVVIAIVDSGTDWIHEDLSSNIWINEDEIEDNGIDDDNNGFIDDINGWGFCVEISNEECIGGPDPNSPAAIHGTLVAGVPGAITNNAIGISGATWNALIMPIAANPVPEPIGFLNTLFARKGILYAAMNNADIINTSFAGEDLSEEERQIVELATSMGSLIVSAAANQGRNIDEGAGIYPAQFPGVLSVGSVIGNKLEGYSNYGSSVNVFTQGTVVTTYPGGEYDIVGGTSFATPLAASVAALIKTKNPTWTPEMIRLHIMATAENIDRYNLGYEGKLGFGKINVLKAVTEEYNSSGVLVTNTSASNYEVKPKESVKIAVTVKSYLNDIFDLSIRLVEKKPSEFVVWNLQEVKINSIQKTEQTTVFFELNIIDDVSRKDTLDLKIDLHFDNQVLSIGEINSIKILSNFDLDILAKTHHTLKAIYKLTNGDQWDDNTGWDTTATPGSMLDFDLWYGVSIRNDHVHTLNLTANNLNGTIPPEIGNLTELGFLVLNGNRIIGSIPQEIGHLTKLENLWLSENNLIGPIPSEIGNLTELKFLDLDDNELSGEVPESFENLTKLRYLYIAKNKLTNNLPRGLLQIKNLDTFYFNDNFSLCAPTDDIFQNWLHMINNFAGENCTTDVSTEEQSKQEQIYFYPNPVIDFVTFEGLPFDANVNVYDALGRQIQITNESRINMTGLSSGVYFYIITSENERISGTLIKQ